MKGWSVVESELRVMLINTRKNVIIPVNFNYAKDFYHILLYTKNIVFISSSEGNREKN